jgi:2-oxoisovalerate dehydrogenase E2 component (dihydrolipoyl transacylase)
MPAVVMPQPGQSVTEGTVVRWLKQVGDHVALDDILVEVETEKVNVEVPSPFAGTLTQILVQEGETVPVGTELAIVGEASETPAVQQPSVPETERAAEGATHRDGEQPPAAPAAAVAGVTVAAGPAPRRDGGTSDRNGAAAGGATRYSPAVLRLAAEHNLDLSRIPGTGLGGRVTRKDVVQFLERGPQPPAAPVAVAPAPAEPVTPPTRPVPPAGARIGLGEERELAASLTPAAPAPAPPSIPAHAPTAAELAEGEEIVRPSPTRLTIARNMLRTAQTVPAAWMVVEVDVSGLVRLRERHRESFRQREGVDLTYLPFIIQTIVAALKEQPMLNSEWRDDQIVLKKRINLGVAVGVEEGLVVPVIHNADRLSLSGLAHALADLTARARARRLRIEDVTGGTFTLDNTGVFGSLVSQPIINPPQAAIISTEAIIKRPIVHDDAIAVRSMMNLCITFDHRIVDGSHVGPFMQDIKRRLEMLGPETPLT